MTVRARHSTLARVFGNAVTRDEQRAAIIEVMKTAFNRVYDYEWDKLPDDIAVEHSITAAFDAQATAGVRVVPVEATDEMIAAGINHRDNSQDGLGATFDVMSAVGDLTNRPGEAK